MVQRLHNFTLGTVTNVGPMGQTVIPSFDLHKAWDLGVRIGLSVDCRNTGLSRGFPKYWSLGVKYCFSASWCISCASTVHFSGVPRITHVQDLLRALLLGFRSGDGCASTVCLFSHKSPQVIQSINFPFLRSSIDAKDGCTTSCRGTG